MSASWDQTLDFRGVCVLAGGCGLHAVLFILSERTGSRSASGLQGFLCQFHSLPVQRLRHKNRKVM